LSWSTLPWLIKVGLKDLHTLTLCKLSNVGFIKDYEAYNTGVADNAFLKRSNGSIYVGSVWPGPAVFPDWFAPGTQGYW